MTIRNLTYDQACARMRQIHADTSQLARQERLSASDEQRFDDLNAEFVELSEHCDRLDRASQLASGAGSGLRRERGSAGDYDRDPLRDARDANGRFRGRNPWDLRGVETFGRDSEEVASELRARALSAIEYMPGASDAVRAAATEILERHDTVDSKIARHCLVTSDPAYLRAWSKTAKNPQNPMLSPDEQQAMREAEQFRAMSLTDSAGGFLVPFQLDPTVIVTSSGVYSEITEAARQVVATGDVWHGVSAAAVQWSWDAEAAEVSDDSPTFGQPSIPVYKAAGFVPISIEGIQDMANVTEEVGKLFAEGQRDLEGTALITGSGSGQPTGIVTALSGTSSVVNAATDDTFALADVYALQGALPARHRRNASWLANNLIYNRVRQFDTNGGAGLWSTLGEDRAQALLGRRVLEAEAMDGTITTAGAGHNYAAIFGDFSNFVVARRLGMTVELIPHLFGANRRPTGQRGWYAWYRVGSDSINDDAFRMLDIVSAS
ncbi:phage major capsid protein [Mycolicibacterium parafortuitum]|uniref:Putative PhiRv1 phage protein [Mycobacterium tuberculosis H37Rv] n=1 Tax=Mycolicibacterium parafortuitum TaxID=39692 RepID=A0A375YK90_MYCPF|nr:phage major capsid protein [Mycolicibacterium parafortuitum]ORB26622.1 capsid protein [Mycolicibacterium parafortuitum]SRX81550.1 putative PhiRv1 phage protein [Mycobacterium tuberculosis H37Rv] [Mycolicibacterium parafortuitum]